MIVSPDSIICEGTLEPPFVENVITTAFSTHLAYRTISLLTLYEKSQAEVSPLSLYHPPKIKSFFVGSSGLVTVPPAIMVWDGTLVPPFDSKLTIYFPSHCSTTSMVTVFCPASYNSVSAVVMFTTAVPSLTQVTVFPLILIIPEYISYSYFISPSLSVFGLRVNESSICRVNLSLISILGATFLIFL